MLFSQLKWAIEDREFEEIMDLISEIELLAELRFVEALIHQLEKYEKNEIPKDSLLAVLEEERNLTLVELRRLWSKKSYVISFLKSTKAKEVEKVKQ